MHGTDNAVWIVCVFKRYYCDARGNAGFQAQLGASMEHAQFATDATTNISMVCFINVALGREIQARMVNTPGCDGVCCLRIVLSVLAGL